MGVKAVNALELATAEGRRRRRRFQDQNSEPGKQLLFAGMTPVAYCQIRRVVGVGVRSSFGVLILSQPRTPCASRPPLTPSLPCLQDELNKQSEKGSYARQHYSRHLNAVPGNK